MPTRANDERCSGKKRHIGNDYVTIVYNDSGEKYNIATIKVHCSISLIYCTLWCSRRCTVTHTLQGQFNYVNIVVEPLDHVSHAVSMLCKDGMYCDSSVCVSSINSGLGQDSSTM